MNITLTLSQHPDGTDRLTGFYSFWLRYVRGFNPNHHCQRSLLGENDRKFGRDMAIGKSYELLEPTKYKYIYLCGLTPKPHQEEGLHLALKPEPGATTAITTYNGIKITVTNARKLDFPNLPDGFQGMGRRYTSCLNWQFGVEYFGTDKLYGKPTVIIKVGAEGGVITLFGCQNPDKEWMYFSDSDERTLKSFDKELDFAQIYSRTKCVHTWEQAIGLIEKYPWIYLYPLEVHPEFREKVWGAVLDNGKKVECHNFERWVDGLRNWHRLCFGNKLK